MSTKTRNNSTRVVLFGRSVSCSLSVSIFFWLGSRMRLRSGWSSVNATCLRHSHHVLLYIRQVGRLHTPITATSAAGDQIIRLTDETSANEVCNAGRCVDLIPKTDEGRMVRCPNTRSRSGGASRVEDSILMICSASLSAGRRVTGRLWRGPGHTAVLTLQIQIRNRESLRVSGPHLQAKSVVNQRQVLNKTGCMMNVWMLFSQGLWLCVHQHECRSKSASRIGQNVCMVGLL